MTKRVLSVAKVLLPLVIAFFIGRVIYRNWQHVREAEWELAPSYLLVSFLLTACWFTVRPLVWSTLLKRLGYPISFRSAYLVVRRAELSRYVPGTIWQYLSRVYLAGRYGVPAAVCMAATFLETVLLILASLGPAVWNLDALLPDLGPISAYPARRHSRGRFRFGAPQSPESLGAAAVSCFEAAVSRDEDALVDNGFALGGLSRGVGAARARRGSLCEGRDGYSG